MGLPCQSSPASLAPLHTRLQRPAPAAPRPAAFPSLAEAQDWLCPRDTWAGQGVEGRANESETTPDKTAATFNVKASVWRLPLLPLPCRL